MNKFARKFLPLAVAAATAASTLAGLGAAHGAANVTVNWFVGLGTGTDSQQIATEKKVVDEFNNGIGKDKGITLAIQIGANYATSMDTITTLIASGNAPDIAGPVGVAGSNALADQWMDLKPLIDKNKYDMTSFDPSVLSLYQTINGGYSAIPFAVYPSILYYNTALFDEAGLKYPPTKVGDQYTFPDGSKGDWNFDTITKLGKMLTVDKAGNDATNSKFDAKNIVQYGFNFQWAQPRLYLTDLQPSAFYDATTKKVKISDDWRKAIAWIQSGLWKDHFISGATAEASTLLQPTAFDSGHLAMALTPLWYTCCLADTAGKLKWNIAVVPASLDGKTHNAVDADTFRVFKSTKNADATFTVLTYLEGDAVPELAGVYGAFPALAKYQQPWIDGKNKIFPQGVNWTVATDMLKYTNPSNLHHEANLPHFQQIQDRFSSFGSDLFGDSGATMDTKAAVDKLEKDLQSIVDGTFPTSTPVPTPTPAPTKAAS